MKETCTYNVLKATEGGMGQKMALQLLKDAGIKAKRAYSIYVGHTAVEVTGGKRVHARADKIIFG